ncbi:hypothetical protein GGTG_01807 [Gaeumannomyces tritici R3-111a-1]|uniref:Uncharacterized protein n=1 Tax=Gaeumannomyces tritici (strain R3-111a-1) TaxID=644352 RepID=J3NKL6_GAET3|nr:hypothetical protein GGTG_01807 [Gaeumannomyces tritici R3-111a-1]EJT81833.1 hypothetical protein GGTG_01807 [Gaeumannomyces tritici R3-111a-1]
MLVKHGGTDVVAELAARRAPSKDDEKKKADWRNPNTTVFTPEQLREQAARLQREQEAEHRRT